MGFFCPCAILTAQTHPDSYCKVLSSLKDFGKLIYKKAYNKGDVKPWSVFSLAIFLLFFFLIIGIPQNLAVMVLSQAPRIKVLCASCSPQQKFIIKVQCCPI